jgi:hypothetical protein
MHLLIVSESSSASFCKTMMSAAVLGYPTPIVVNWAKELPDKLMIPKREGFVSMADGVNDYLAKLDTSHNDDFVVILEGESIMQLRASTLVERFFSVNRRANQRISKNWGKTAARNGIRQDVLFGAQKECNGLSANDAACYGAPASTLPAKLYGDNTDIEGGDDDNRFDLIRPRFMDSGSVVGTVAGLRKIFKAAAAEGSGKDDREKKVSLQRIFGRQQSYREVLRRKAGLKSNKGFTKDHLAKVRETITNNPNGTYEFGIGLDYASEISANAAFSHEDYGLVTFSDSNSLQETRKNHKIGLTDAMKPFPPEISNTLPPFWTFSVEPALPRWDPWKSTPLITNLYTGISPAIVRPTTRGNHGAGLPKPWYQKHARTLFDVNMYAPIVPVAVGGENASTTREFWAMEIWKGGGRDSRVPVMSGDGWVRFDFECEPHGEEVFKDGLGKWKLPENH